MNVSQPEASLGQGQDVQMGPVPSAGATPDPLTGRYDTVPVVGKRALEGKYAHVLDNVKVARRTEGNEACVPALELTDLYDEDIRLNGRRKRVLRGEQNTQEIASPVPRPTAVAREDRPRVVHTKAAGQWAPFTFAMALPPRVVPPMGPLPVPDIPMPQIPPLQIPPPRSVSPIRFPAHNAQEDPLSAQMQDLRVTAQLPEVQMQDLPVAAQSSEVQMQDPRAAAPSVQVQATLPSARTQRGTPVVQTSPQEQPGPAPVQMQRDPPPAQMQMPSQPSMQEPLNPRPPARSGTQHTQMPPPPVPPARRQQVVLQPAEVIHIVKTVNALYSGGARAMTDQQAWDVWHRANDEIKTKLVAYYQLQQNNENPPTARQTFSSGPPSSTAQRTGPLQEPRGWTAPMVVDQTVVTDDDVVLPFTGSAGYAESVTEVSDKSRTAKAPRIQRNKDKGKQRATAVPETNQVNANAGPSRQERTLNPRPTPLQEPTAAFVGGDVVTVVVEQIQDLAQVVQEQCEAQRMLASQVKHIRVLVETQQPAPVPVTKPFMTVREEKLAGTSPRRKKRDKKIETKAKKQGRRKKGAKAGDEADDEDEDDDVHLNRLKARVRHTLVEMLHIADWGDAAHQYPPLSEDQITSYLARDPEIVPTATNFRVDFSPGHGWKKFPLNKEARMIFIDKYFCRVNGGAFFNKPTPPHLLTRETVGDVLDEHMRYCRARWMRSLNPISPEKAQEIARRVCQASRKATLHEAREVTLVRRDYTRHRALFRLLEPANMSGDETDGPTKAHPPVFRVIIAAWQSPALRQFLHTLDAMYREDWARRRTGGNPPRVRVVRAESRVEEGIPPIGLWRNCYDRAWLQQQPAYVLRDLEIVDEDYDFSL